MQKLKVAGSLFIACVAVTGCKAAHGTSQLRDDPAVAVPAAGAAAAAEPRFPAPLPTEQTAKIRLDLFDTYCFKSCHFPNDRMGINRGLSADDQRQALAELATMIDKALSWDPATKVEIMPQDGSAWHDSIQNGDDRATMRASLAAFVKPAGTAEADELERGVRRAVVGFDGSNADDCQAAGQRLIANVQANCKGGVAKTLVDPASCPQDAGQRSKGRLAWVCTPAQ